MNAVATRRNLKRPAPPPDQVVAVLNRPEDVAAARMEFREAGFTARDIVVLEGNPALRRLDAAAHERTLLDRLVGLFLRHLTDPGLNSLDRQLEELRVGHHLIGVGVRSAEERRRAEAILLRCHGHFISCCAPPTLTRTAA
jgi:hypothetical protein